jgi:hypothetical protein
MSALPQVNPYLVTGTQKQPAPWFVGKGLEMGEQGLYHLPRDTAGQPTSATTSTSGTISPFWARTKRRATTCLCSQ